MKLINLKNLVKKLFYITPLRRKNIDIDIKSLFNNNIITYEEHYIIVTDTKKEKIR